MPFAQGFLALDVANCVSPRFKKFCRDFGLTASPKEAHAAAPFRAALVWHGRSRALIRAPLLSLFLLAILFCLVRGSSWRISAPDAWLASAKGAAAAAMSAERHRGLMLAGPPQALPAAHRAQTSCAQLGARREQQDSKKRQTRQS
jgi:hypothetical protein